MENLQKVGILLEVNSLITKPHVLSLFLHPELTGSTVSKEVEEGAITKLVSDEYLNALLRGPCSNLSGQRNQGQPLPFLGANLLTLGNIILITFLRLCLPD